jgi:type IV pilus assembly protein PilM
MVGTNMIGDAWVAGSDLAGQLQIHSELLSASASLAGGAVISGLSDLFGAKPLVGISIGAASVKAAEMKKAGKTWKLARFGLTPLPEDSVVNREVFNGVAVANAVQSAHGQARIPGKTVVTGLGGAAIIIKRMNVEVQKVSELQDAVFWEAEQYLPFDPTEVSMDYHTISRAKDNRTDVLFVAAKLSVMDGFVSAITDAGLKVKIVDTEYFALQNIFEANYDTRPGESVAIVDIGASALKVVVLHEGVPVFTKESPMGGKNLTAEIQRQMNLSPSDAEALKISQGRGAVPQEIVELTQVAVENFATEIRRALDFYNASSSGAPVAYVLVTGGSSLIPELSKGIEERVSLPTQLLNPFARIGYDEKVFTPEMIASVAPFIAVPMGYAIRGGA